MTLSPAQAPEPAAQPHTLMRAHRAILSAVCSVAAANLVVKLAAMSKEMAVAAAFGRTDALEAFLAALLIPNLLVNLLAESMNQSLIPTLVRVREQEGAERAQQLFSSTLLWLVVLLIAVSVFMLVAAPLAIPVVSSNFAPAKRTLTTALYCALLPIVLLSGIASNCTAVLASRDRFLAPALAPALVSLTMLATLAAGGMRTGIWWMVWATLAGTLLQALTTASLLHRHGYHFSLRWHGATPAVREVGRKYLPVLGSSLVASAGLLVDQAMAASLRPGSVAGLAYANRFVNVMLTLLAGTIATAVVPSFSRLLAHGEWENCRTTVRHWTLICFAASAPLTLSLIVLSRWLVQLTLQHGAFHPSDTREVAHVMVLYALQIPFFVASRVDYRLIVALGRTDLVLWCGMINLVLDVVLNLALMRVLGLAGIALATSLWTVSTFLFLRYWSERLMRDP